MVPVSYLSLRTHGPGVVRLMAAAFARAPDPSGLGAMVAALESGASLASLAESLVLSPEFVALHGAGSEGPADADFIRRIAGFAQAGPAAGLGLAPGATRADVLVRLAECPAAVAALPLFPGLAAEAPPDDETAYRLWVEIHDTPDRAQVAAIGAIPGAALVSVVMACGDSTVAAASRSLESLRGQTDPGWELCLVAGLRSPWPREELARLAASEPRLHVIDGAPGHADSATPLSAGLLAARGDLVCFLDPGDELAPTALGEVQAAFAADPGMALLYSDEDRIAAGRRFAPRFKTAYSADAMLAGNAIGQLAVYRRGLIAAAGGLPAAGQTPLWDLAARAATRAGPAGIHHLAAILCHRAAAPADWPADWPLSGRGGAWPRPAPGLAAPPLASIIVLTRDHADLLAACAEGVLDRTDYPAIELLVVDNGSVAPACRDLLARLERRPGVRVLRRPGAFNFAALNNDAARQATGDLLVLLNNDIEVLQPDWLREMAALALQPDIGAVGARLLYPDGTLQHGGILLGPDGQATHVGRGAARDAPGYDGHLAYAHDFSAVTGACLAMRREVFASVGGMNEDLAVTWNDVDLCLRVRAAGLRVVWTPHAVLMHREAATRGLEDTDPAKHARFKAEQALVCGLWPDAMRADPFLNANLVAGGDGLRLATPRLARPWQAPSLRAPS